MPSVREIMLQRAKVPAKVHAMEGVLAEPPAASRVSPRGALAEKLGGPIVVEYAAAQAAEASAAAAKPPRPRPSGAQPGTSPGSNGSGMGPRKMSEGRKPRSGSQPAVQRAPSEPRLNRRGGAGGAASDDASENGRAAAPKAKARASSLQRVRMGDAPPPVDRKDVGKVPGYLKKRNEEMAEEKRRAARPASPQPPPGYRKVGDAEKQATLEVLRRRRQEVEKAQRQLPLKIESVGQKQREKDLSDRISHLDKLLSMFGQPTVFIPADAEPIADSLPPLAPAGDDEELIEAGNRGRSGGCLPREAPGPRQPSRERRPRPEAAPAPWAMDEIGGPQNRSGVKTNIQVAAPPGGRASVSLSWE